MRREAEECAPAACRMRPKGGDRGRKIWTASKDVWKPGTPLKSPKTAKALFGKAWSKTREFWRSLEGALFRHVGWSSRKLLNSQMFWRRFSRRSGRFSRK